MDQRVARGPNKEIAGDSGEDKIVIRGKAQGGEADKQNLAISNINKKICLE